MQQARPGCAPEDVTLKTLLHVIDVGPVYLDRFESLDFVFDIRRVLGACKVVNRSWHAAASHAHRTLNTRVMQWAVQPQLLPWTETVYISTYSRVTFYVSAMKALSDSALDQCRLMKLILCSFPTKPASVRNVAFSNLSTALVHWIVQHWQQHTGGVRTGLRILEAVTRNGLYPSAMRTEAFVQALLGVVQQHHNQVELVQLVCQILVTLLSSDIWGRDAFSKSFCTREENMAVFCQVLQRRADQGMHLSHGKALCTLIRVMFQFLYVDVLGSFPRLFVPHYQRAFETIVRIFLDSAMNRDVQIECLNYFDHAILPWCPSQVLLQYAPAILTGICKCVENFPDDKQMPLLCANIMNHLLVHPVDSSASLQKWLFKTVLDFITGRVRGAAGNSSVQNGALRCMNLLIRTSAECVVHPHEELTSSIIITYLSRDMNVAAPLLIRGKLEFSLYTLMEALDILFHACSYPRLVLKFVAAGGHRLLLRIAEDERLYGRDLFVQRSAIFALLKLVDDDGCLLALPRLYARDMRSLMELHAFRGSPLLQDATTLYRLLPPEERQSPQKKTIEHREPRACRRGSIEK